MTARPTHQRKNVFNVLSNRNLLLAPEYVIIVPLQQLPGRPIRGQIGQGESCSVKPPILLAIVVLRFDSFANYKSVFFAV
jgi:hypothetical protein